MDAGVWTLNGRVGLRSMYALGSMIFGSFLVVMFEVKN